MAALRQGAYEGSAEYDPWQELARELDRARRYGRDFVLMKIPVRTSGIPARASAIMRVSRNRRRDATADYARAVSAVLRTVDRVWVHEGAVYALLPESDRSIAEALLLRLADEMPELLPEDGVRLAAFPADGLTSGALLEQLEREPVHARTPATREELDGALREQLAHRSPSTGRAAAAERSPGRRVVVTRTAG